MLIEYRGAELIALLRAFVGRTEAEVARSLEEAKSRRELAKRPPPMGGPDNLAHAELHEVLSRRRKHQGEIAENVARKLELDRKYYLTPEEVRDYWGGEWIQSPMNLHTGQAP